MGIKGIYGEIGAGERIALSKLAIDNYEQKGRPFRIAIDVAIWQFQTQAGRGGSDPATRTFYYRLLRLLALSIQPLFVFDGPNKPPFKRNKRTGSNGGSVSNLLTKQLLTLFGFPYHCAPGEAEAECALLQLNGIVDAVLSEDIDTLMFGSELCLRNWSSEDSRGNHSPTHVSAYYKKTVSERYGLDREGMILVALMSGGDYNTEGIHGCGIKLACEAARAGFGKSLCNISQSDIPGYNSWREELSREIFSNNGKFFKTKRKTIKIPENFPDREILGYYTHPIVSTAAKILKLKEEIKWHGAVDVPGLRRFVAEAFEWTNKAGAIRFIRGLAPALFVHKLRILGETRSNEFDDILLTSMNETEIVRTICGRRTHFSTDGIVELRLVYHPLDIVGLKLDEEENQHDDFGRDGLAPRNAENRIEEYLSNEEGRSKSPLTENSVTYDPTQPDKLWVARAIARVGVPLKVEDYEESFRNPAKFLKAKAAGRKALSKKETQNKATVQMSKSSKPKEISKALPQSRPSKSLTSTIRSTSHSHPCTSREKQVDLKKSTDVSKPKKTSNTTKLSLPIQNGPTTKISLKVKTNETFRSPSPISFSSSISASSPQFIDQSSFNFHSPPLVFEDESNEISRKFQSFPIKSAEHVHLEVQPKNKHKKVTKNRKASLTDENLSVDRNELHNPNDDFYKVSTSRLDDKVMNLFPSPDLSEISAPPPIDRRKTAKNNSPQKSRPFLYPIDLSTSPNTLFTTCTKKIHKSVINTNLPDDSCIFSHSNFERIKDVRPPGLPSRVRPPSPYRVQKKIIALRDSLPGAWKLVDDISDSQASAQSTKETGKELSRKKSGRGSRWRMSEIEFLDLTAEQA
ncbi:putative flap structure-specific endonuclease protein [Golovinomyces cichoracearum]|uniref:Putative flap structure-specific endonuclease protein n=1 Tax=Golovinomyces cichoracearum TaxID=62708 RepID=A0A420H9J2_9PEZI|nr:putative flap structure-specific endonuclease protein [Golovinomyces cichoracearum]